MPFYEYLITGANKGKPKDFIRVHDIVLNECDTNDNSSKLHIYAKEIMRDFCKNRLLKELSALRNEALLERYMALWKNFKIFTHSINKLFSYLNRYHLKN